MSRRLPTPRGPFAALALVLVALVAAVGVSACNAKATAGSAHDASLSVTGAAEGHTVPAGFLGVSMEYRGLEDYLGPNPKALDSPFVQLLRNLQPSGGFILRIGGDSSDWTWWPVPHTAEPGGVRYALTPTWATIARDVASSLHGHLILGLNLEADSARVASYEATQLLDRVGRSYVSTLELGNEPELYSAFNWYKTKSGVGVKGRPPGWDPSEYISDFGRIASALPSFPLAGPSSGSAKWLSYTGSFLEHNSRVKLVTAHSYPLKHCSASTHLVAGQFFQPAALQDLANNVRGYVRLAGAHHMPVRVDEMNSISCGGQKGLSTAFAPALWALDMLPRLVATGAQGVNFHTVPNTLQALFSAAVSHGGWRVAVEPEYYGLLAFSQAAPTGSELLRVTGSQPSGLDVWADRSPGGVVHVVFVNSSSSTETTTIRISAKAASTTATVSRLSAPGLYATSGVTLGGQSIDRTTGAMRGAPSNQSVTGKDGVYRIEVGRDSASILTLG